jgi:hypothetical protein
MGGPLSGRRKDRTRKTVECYLVLDVNELSQKGSLRTDFSSTCQWVFGNESFSITVHAEAEKLHLSYSLRVGDGERENVADVIPIVHAHCRYGGRRAYFICPGPQDGTNCGRRISKLHLSHRYFLCRHCNRLAYASQYEKPWQRALRRANRLKQRLNIGVGLADPFPEKPGRMWTRTYNGLVDGILQAEIVANETQAKRFQKLSAQVDNDLQSDQPKGRRP